MKNFYLISFLLLFSFQNLSAQGETCQTATAIMPGLNVADGPSSGNGCHDCSPGDVGGIPAENADWFTYTPTESGVIDISTCGGGVDTRVWVYTGDCGNLTQIAGSDDACDFAPGEPFAASLENLTVFGGTTYYIEFDDAWETSGFEFNLNFTKISNNVFIEGFEVCFTQIPTSELTGNGIALNFTVGKQGPAPQSGVMVQTEIFAVGSGAAVATFNSATFDLPDNPITITSGAIQNLPVGTYFLVQTVMPSGGDENATDNVATSRTFQITDRTFAVDNDTFVGSLGVPGPGRIRQGQHFNFENSTDIHSVSFNVLGGNAGDSVWAEIFDVNALTGAPENLLAVSKKIIVESGDPAWIEIPFATPFNIASDNTTLFVSLTHLATGSNIDLGVSEDIFKPRKSWISVEDDPWVPLESIGTGDFQFAYAIRANNNSNENQLTVSVDMKDEMVSTDGVFLNYSLDGVVASPALMTDLGNNIWETTISIPLLSTVTYLFQNGNSAVEIVPSNCGVEIGGENFRTAKIRFADVTVPAVCFGRCGICPIQGCSDPAYILCDDFEQYDPGALSLQSLFWTTWDVDSGDGVVNRGNSVSGNQSLLIDESLPGEPQDVLLLLNDVTDGAYELKWNQLVETGNSAYFGTLHRNPTDDVAGHGFFFDPGGSGEIWNGNTQTATFNYPENAWFEILLKVDFNNDYSTLSIDGNEVAFMRFSDASDIDGNPLPPLSQLAGINFFPIDVGYKWYVDDVFYREISGMADANVCFDAEDVNFFLPIDTFIVRENQNASSELGDPTIGIDCYVDEAVDNSTWFTFKGDGQRYRIRAGFPIETDPLGGQLAAISMSVYSGDCENLTEISCEDDVFDEELIFQTEDGKDYFIMIDGDTRDNNASGVFRLAITQMVRATFNLNMKNYLAGGNPIASSGPEVLYDTGDFEFAAFDMTNNGDSTYTGNFLMPANSSRAYFFSNGLSPGFEPQDSLASCRVVVSNEDDLIDPLVCWGLCDDCPDFVSTENLFSNNKIQLFPNPTDDILNLRFENISGQSAELNIFNQLGQAIFYQKLEGNFLNEKIDVSYWLSGVYYISIRNEKGAFFEKIIVE